MVPETIDKELRDARFGDESFAETLEALLGSNRVIRCPGGALCATADSRDWSRRDVEMPGLQVADPADRRLRIHEQFEDNRATVECHSRFRDVLEILALMNILRYLVKSKEGRDAIANTAFILDGPLAAFGTIAILARAVHDELRGIQECLKAERIELLVMSGVKSGPFVEHFAELDRAPEPGRHVSGGSYYLPGNSYVRENIVAGSSDDSKPWGELTYFGRPVFLKTVQGSDSCSIWRNRRPTRHSQRRHLLVFWRTPWRQPIPWVSAHISSNLCGASMPRPPFRCASARTSSQPSTRGGFMIRQSPWPYASAERRWYGMGRYYAMFPPRFAFDAIEGLTRTGDRVLDPFCGRGNAPFTAAVMGRPCLGIDINPIAWLYTAVKLNPDPKPDRVVRRLKAIGRAARKDDRRFSKPVRDDGVVARCTGFPKGSAAGTQLALISNRSDVDGFSHASHARQARPRSFERSVANDCVLAAVCCSLVGRTRHEASAGRQPGRCLGRQDPKKVYLWYAIAVLREGSAG